LEANLLLLIKTFPTYPIELPNYSIHSDMSPIGNAGLGKASTLALCKHNPAHIYLAARNPEKAKKAISSIQELCPDVPITFLECDLSSLKSVQTAANQFTSQIARLDILICNAGIMAVPAGFSQDGYEIQFGTNHVGHALLIKLLLPSLLKTASEPNSDVRIITLTSIGHNWTTSTGIDFASLKTDLQPISTWARYGQSKLANILYSKALAKRYPTIKCASVHPGLVDTNLAHTLIGENLFLKFANSALNCLPLLVKRPEDGMKNQLWAATAKTEEVKSGEYYEPVAVSGNGSRWTKDDKLIDDLWAWTEKELAGYNL